MLLDSDGQYPIDNLGLFLEQKEQGSSRAFIGWRREKADSAFARFGSWISGACCNLFHGTAYRDFNCALKLVEGRLLRDLCLEAKGAELLDGDQLEDPGAGNRNEGGRSDSSPAREGPEHADALEGQPASHAFCFLHRRTAVSSEARHFAAAKS